MSGNRSASTFRKPKIWLRTCLVAAILVVPSSPVGATWYSPGGFEPDTPQDVAQGFMFLEPDVGAGGLDSVYFNVVVAGENWPTVRNSNPNRLGLFIPPNLAALQTRMYTPEAIMGAYLGLWKDCNRDGYIGSMTGGLVVYPSALLPADDVCRYGTEHHSDGEVHEFLPIVPVSTGDPRLREIVDPSAVVWGDWGLPGQPRPDAPHRQPDVIFVPRPFAGSLPAVADPSPPWIQAPPPEPDLVFIESDWGPGRPRWFTFYADVGINTYGRARLPPSGVYGSIYGSEWCYGQPEGTVSGGFDCDPTRWWTVGPPPLIDEIQLDPRPGDKYRLRDIDCYDASVVPGVSLTYLLRGEGCPALF